MAKDGRLELRVEPELLARIDAARGLAARAAWVTDVLERALGAASGDVPTGVRSRVSEDAGSSPGVPAQPRMSVRREELQARKAERAAAQAEGPVQVRTIVEQRIAKRQAEVEARRARVAEDAP